MSPQMQLLTKFQNAYSIACGLGWKFVCACASMVSNNMYTYLVCIGEQAFLILSPVLLLCKYVCLSIYVLNAWMLKIFGRTLPKFGVVTFEIHCGDQSEEDSGVLEMHAMLRGEEGYDHHLDQRQRLPMVPNFNPYNEICLAQYFFRARRHILKIYESMKIRGGFSFRIMDKIIRIIDPGFFLDIKKVSVVNVRN